MQNRRRVPDELYLAERNRGDITKSADSSVRVKLEWIKTVFSLEEHKNL